VEWLSEERKQDGRHGTHEEAAMRLVATEYISLDGVFEEPGRCRPVLPRRAREGQAALRGGRRQECAPAGRDQEVRRRHRHSRVHAAQGVDVDNRSVLGRNRLRRRHRAACRGASGDETPSVPRALFLSHRRLRPDQSVSQDARARSISARVGGSAPAFAHVRDAARQANSSAARSSSFSRRRFASIRS